MKYKQAQTSALINFIFNTSGPFQCFALDPCALVAVIAGAVCRARSLAFCIRRGILPPEVRALFGGWAPSPGHGTRICRILRAEYQRQIRLYRECLYLRLLDGADSSGRGSRWREFSRTIDRTVEFLWRQTLIHLRASTPETTPAVGNLVHKLGDVELPVKVEGVLSQGPKFAVEPRKSPPELLTMVRQVSGRAPESEVDRCISEGVDVLSRCKPSGSKVPLKSTVAYLKEHSLSLLPADKALGTTS
ncbi:hypothetical protein ISCGN_005959 [Ixodes scapularis]